MKNTMNSLSMWSYYHSSNKIQYGRDHTPLLCKFLYALYIFVLGTWILTLYLCFQVQWMHHITYWGDPIMGYNKSNMTTATPLSHINDYNFVYYINHIALHYGFSLSLSISLYLYLPLFVYFRYKEYNVGLWYCLTFN